MKNLSCKAIFFILVLALAFAQFRFKSAYTLSVLPDELLFMNNELVLKIGRTVELRTGNNFTQIQRTFDLPFSQAKFAAFPSSQQIVFISQHGISKSTQSKTPVTNLTICTANPLSTYGLQLTSKGEMFIIPPINSSQQLLLANSSDQTITSLPLQGTQPITGDIVRSQVVVVDQSYYFSMGATSINSTKHLQLFFLFEANTSGYINVFNFTVPSYSKALNGSKYNLQTVQDSDSHYFLITKQGYEDFLQSYTVSIFQLAVKTGDKYTSLGISQHIRIKASALASKDRLIYFTPQCEIFQSHISQWPSNKPRIQGIDKSLFVVGSPDSSILVAFNTTLITNNKYASANLLKLNQNSSYSLVSTLPQNNGGVGFIDCSFFNGNQLIAVYEGTNTDGVNQLSFFSIGKLAYAQDVVYEVDDYSVCPNSTLFYVRTKQTIALYKLQNDSVTQIANATQDYTTTANFSCGWDNSLFVYIKEKYDFDKWNPANGTLIKTASMKQFDALKAIFEDSIMFNQFYEGVQFVDYNLNSLSVPFKQTKAVSAKEIKGDFILFADYYQSTATYSVLYEYVNRTLIYKGHFPVSIEGSPVLRRVILPQSREIYLDYYSKDMGVVQSIKYQIDNPPQYRKGIISNQYFTNCYFISSAITKSLDLIVIPSTNLSISKYSLENLNLTDKVLLSSLYNVNNFKISTSQTYICVWGQSINSPKSILVQIRLINNLSATVLQKEMLNHGAGEDIIDCEINDLQRIAILSNKSGGSTYLNLFENTIKDVKVEPTVSSVTAMAVCEDNGDYAYTGVSSQTGLPLSYMIVDSLQQSNSSRIDSGCEAEIIVFGRECSVVGYVCTDNTVNVYNRTANSSIFSKAFAQTITKLQILSDTKVLVSTPSSINIVDYANLTNKADVELSAAANSSIAIDFTRGLIAYSSDLKSITIADFDGQTVDAIANRDGFDVLALTFKSTGELFASFNVTAANSASSLMIWSNETCPQNQTLSNSYCVCLDTYHFVDGSCVCLNNQILVDGMCQCPQKSELKDNVCYCKGDLAYINQDCQCASGFTEVENYACQKCSFLCSQHCNDGGLFACEQFGVWFYVIVGGVLLIAIGIGVIVRRRFRKGKESVLSSNINNSKRELLSQEAF